MYVLKFKALLLSMQMWLFESIPEWLWMWGSYRLNQALQRQALERLDLKKPRVKSADSMDNMEEILQARP